MLTIDQLIAKVRELADDTIYGDECACKYLEGTCSNGTCGCIFGQALLAVGLPVADLQDADAREDSIADLLDNLGIKHSPIERDWCLRVQSGQDAGKTWREAVTNADLWTEKSNHAT